MQGSLAIGRISSMSGSSATQAVQPAARRALARGPSTRMHVSAAAGGPPQGAGGSGGPLPPPTGGAERGYKVALVTGGNTGEPDLLFGMSVCPLTARHSIIYLQPLADGVPAPLHLLRPPPLNTFARTPAASPDPCCRHRAADCQGAAAAGLLCGAGLPQPGASRGSARAAAVGRPAEGCMHFGGGCILRVHGQPLQINTPPCCQLLAPHCVRCCALIMPPFMCVYAVGRLSQTLVASSWLSLIWLT